MNASSPHTTGEPHLAEAAEGGGSGLATGPLPEASREAKLLAAAILEVLAGSLGPSEAARGLGISLARYYQLETRALAGLVSSCESRRRGGRRPKNELTALQRECEQLRRECARQQALMRATRRTVGLSTPTAATPPQEGIRKRRRRPAARALKMAALLQEQLRESQRPVSGAEAASRLGVNSDQQASGS